MSDRKAASLCPICDRPTDAKHAPFCSGRCKDIDLNRWLSEGYRIAGNPTGDDSEGVAEASDPLGQLSAERDKTRH